MKGELSDNADAYAEQEANRKLYPEPILGDSPSIEDYEKQRRWLAYYCQKRIEFFSLGDRRYEC